MILPSVRGGINCTAIWIWAYIYRIQGLVLTHNLFQGLILFQHTHLAIQPKLGDKKAIHFGYPIN